MDKLSLIFLGVTAFIILVSIILGMVRGTGRSLVRLALVVFSAVAALLIFRKITDILLPYLMNITIQGQTVEAMLTDMFAGMDFAKEKVDQLISIIVGVIVYLIVFGLLQFLTWLIIFPIIKIFVKKSQKVGKASTLVGGAIGIVQAVVIIFAFVMPSMGFVGSLGNAMAIEMPEQVSGGETTASVGSFEKYAISDRTITVKMYGIAAADATATASGGIDLNGIIDFEAYQESKLCKFIDKINGKYYARISSIKVGEDTYTLNGQIETIDSLVKMANKVTRTINNVKNSIGGAEGESSDKLTTGTVEEVKNLFSELGNMQNEMSDEAKKSTNKLIKDAAASLGETYNIDLDLSNVDVMDADFDKEAKIMEDVYNYQESSEVDINEVVKDLSDSTLILPVLENSGVTVPTNEAQKAEVESAIADLEKEGNADAATIAKIKKLFGLTSGETSSETGGEQ